MVPEIYPVKKGMANVFVCHPVKLFLFNQPHFRIYIICAAVLS